MAKPEPHICEVCAQPIWSRQQKASHTYEGRQELTVWAHKNCAERAEGIASGYWKLEGIPSGVNLA